MFPLDLDVCFLPQVRKVFSTFISSNKFLFLSFFFLLSKSPMVWLPSAWYCHTTLKQLLFIFSFKMLPALMCWLQKSPLWLIFSSVSFMCWWNFLMYFSIELLHSLALWSYLVLFLYFLSLLKFSSLFIHWFSLVQWYLSMIFRVSLFVVKLFSLFSVSSVSSVLHLDIFLFLILLNPSPGFYTGRQQSPS